MSELEFFGSPGRFALPPSDQAVGPCEAGRANRPGEPLIGACLLEFGQGGLIDRLDGDPPSLPLLPNLLTLTDTSKTY